MTTETNDQATPEQKKPNTEADSPLGKKTEAPDGYNPALLYTIEREPMRERLGVTGTPPFFGMDFLNAYEFSWLNERGKPQIGILNISVSSLSPRLVESKSLKLYLNSFSHFKGSKDDVLLIIRKDLSDAYGSFATVYMRQPDVFTENPYKTEELAGLSLDRLDISADTYTENEEFLTSETNEYPVEEVLVSNLLKTSCPVTGQPDWASLQIHYVGPQINQEGLLKYIISLRSEAGFHEQCIEKIFLAILKRCKPSSLTVYGRYTRRGGIDINPFRSNFSHAKKPQLARTARQ